MNLSQFAANAILDGTPMPSSLWVKMHLDDPGTNGTNNASADTRRREFTRTAASGGSAEIVTAVEWLAWIADETLTHFTFHDDETTGDVWWIGELQSPVAILTGQRLAIGLDDLIMSLAVWGA